MSASLVGSEMCIRDRPSRPAGASCAIGDLGARACTPALKVGSLRCSTSCLLYTSDAADDM
eukprot:14111182-Alexandrium_andersonii.AAC.1